MYVANFQLKMLGYEWINNADFDQKATAKLYKKQHPNGPLFKDVL